MDFRSQLSAFTSGGGSSGGNSGGNQGSDRSPQRYNDNRGYNNSGNYYGRGGGGGDRRRGRDFSPNRGPPSQRRRFNEPDRDGLGDLRHHGYKIPRGHPPPPTDEEKNQRPNHIALLLICIDDIPYEHIWKEWCETLSGKGDCYISLLCHAKFPKQVKSEWLRQRLLVYPPKSGRGNSYMDPEFLSRQPEWGSIEITRAMLDLLSAGLKIGNDKETDMRFSSDRFLVMGDGPPPQVDQFLFISETCLPVASAPEFFEVMDNTVSWVNARHRKDPGTPKNAYENEQFGLINRRIPGQYRWKADQWVLLCRRHASQIMGIDRPHIPHKYHLWQSYRDINASDEMYIPTTLALLGYLRFTSEGEDTQRLRGISGDDKGRGDDTGNEAATPSNTFEFVKKRPVTYTDWTEGARNPATFASGLTDFQKVSKLAREKGCLVARKFAPFVVVPGVAPTDANVTGQISVEEWKAEIEVLRAKYRETVIGGKRWVPPPPRVPTEQHEDEKEAGEEEGQKTPAAGPTKSEAKPEDNDDDEEENQL